MSIINIIFNKNKEIFSYFLNEPNLYSCSINDRSIAYLKALNEFYINIYLSLLQLTYIKSYKQK